MKKFLSLLLAVMMLLGCIPAMAEGALVWKINQYLGTLKLDGSSKAVGHIDIPAEVDGIPVRALDYMCFISEFDITSITYPDTLRYFERSTLNGTANLAALTLPKNLLIIKNGSFMDMPLIETLVIPPSVSVVNGAFSFLPKMKSITFEGVCPVFVEDNYYGLFTELAADCVIYVPDDQIDAYKAAFADREDVLARIQPSGKNAVVIDWSAPESDFQFDAATGTITGYTGTASRLDIPATIGGVPVKHIGEKAFFKSYPLMYVTIPEGVETIGKYAFCDCSLMTYVSLPTTVRTIGDKAFQNNSLVEVGWSEGLESIGSNAFYSCDIVYADLPTTVRTIADGGLENAGIVELTFGPNVETIGEKGFASKTLEVITYTGSTMPTFGADAFKGCTREATLTLTDESNPELYNSFVTYMANAFPTCVINEPVYMQFAEEMPQPAPIGAEGEPYFGSWKMDMYGMTVILTLNQDGTCTMDMMGETEPGVWTMANGKANVMGDELYIDANGNLVMESQDMVFTRTEAGATTEEMSEEEALLALLAMLAEMDESEGGEPADLPEHLQSYVGTWHMVYIATGGLEGDLRTMGVTGKLELNADGTGRLSGAADDSGSWYDDEGQVRFGQADAPLTLLDGGFLRYGSQLAGYMVFSQDERATWAPAPVVTAAPVMPSAPAASAGVGMEALAGYTDKKYVAKTYTVAGFTTDASMLGAEYALTLYANNTCELSMAGFPVLLKWTQGQGTVNGQTKDALVVDYMGAATYYVYLTEAGIDLDMNGMLLNMVAQ